MFKEAYNQMMLNDQDLKPCKFRILGFNGVATESVGCVDLHVVLDEGDHKMRRFNKK